MTITPTIIEHWIGLVKRGDLWTFVSEIRGKWPAFGDACGRL